MRLHRMLVGLSVGALLWGGTSVQANMVYTYSGPFFNSISKEPADGFRIEGSYTTAMRVTGWFETVDALPGNLLPEDISSRVIAFEFSDGRQTLTDRSLRRFPGGVFDIGTDAVGRINAWHINQSVLFSHPRVPGEFGGNIQVTSRLLPLTRDFGLLFACLVETLPTGSCAFGTAVDGASVFNGDIGSWAASTVAVPLAPALSVFALGLAALARYHRRPKAGLRGTPLLGQGPITCESFRPG